MKTRTIIATLAVVAASIPFLAPLPAHACGALLTSDASADIEAQRALVVWRAATVDVHVQLKVTGNSSDAMWLIPVPARPELKVGDAEIFDALDGLTAPQIALAPSGGVGAGCGDDAVAGNTDTLNRAVSFSESGTVGTYTYELVEASDAQAVIDHLTQAGFTVPDGWEAALTPYLEAEMTFVAARLTDGVTIDTSALQPLVLTVPRPLLTEMVYPVALGQRSASDTVTVRLYQLSNQRHRVVNYGSASLDTVAAAMRSDDVDYATALDGLTSAAAGRLVVTEFARDLRPLSLSATLTDVMDQDAFYLTRSTARVPKAGLEDMLLSFANDAPEEDGIAEFPAASGLWWLMLMLGGVAIWSRKPRPLH